MSNYITTNIRLSEEDYFRLKEEAAKRRKSLSAVIREKVGTKKNGHSKADVEKFMQDIRKLARENAKYLKGVDGVKIIRNMRDNAKW
ncbi:ribbon-helix-helix protein, CopG family [Candidatus Microgenomates bacterium]|nr:ribbon-helix-helix protein, CopG family [Candidatus Microgenomates bacterium]